MKDDETIKREAESFANANKKRIALEVTDVTKFTPDKVPMSVFMAGSPGAGKTEESENLVKILEKNKKHKVVRIDGDDLRHHFSDYKGDNSSLFQGAISILVDKIHDSVLDNKQTFVLDGTFSNYERAVRNIDRSLRRKRPVLIFYVYQKPDVAWRFTQARELLEGRNIPKSAFIDQFINAKETISRIREHFDGTVSIFVIKKNFETHYVEDVIELEVKGESIDHYLGKSYTKDDLERLL